MYPTHPQVGWQHGNGRKRVVQGRVVGHDQSPCYLLHGNGQVLTHKHGVGEVIALVRRLIDGRHNAVDDANRAKTVSKIPAATW